MLMRLKISTFPIAFLLTAAQAFPQFAPTPLNSYKPTSEETQRMAAKLKELDSLFQPLLAKRGAADPLVADVAVYRKAAEWALRYPEEFFKKEYVEKTFAALDTGIARAKSLAAGDAPWAKRKGRFIRGFQSQIDGSYQPYGLMIPDSYDGTKPTRLDVWLHGRGRTLTEVSFIAAHDGPHEISEGAFERNTPAAPIPADRDFIQLDVFGRVNNGYRWAAETDVFEAVAAVQRAYNIDAGKILLRGFSMGGHGAWHIGLHYPDRWAAVEAGAGFTDTKVYGKLSNLTPWQESAVHIYDSQDYALNAFDVPVVGYAGELDPQVQGLWNVRRQLERDGFKFQEEPLRWKSPDLNLLFLIAPKTPHAFHAGTLKISADYIDQMLARPRVPDHIRFVTWTTRYNRCFWVTVDGMEKQYERAEVDAERTPDGRDVTVKTAHVSRLILDGGETIAIDGQKFAAGHGSEPRAFEKHEGQWTLSRGADGKLSKRHGLQGPIDDFMLGPFLCVRPTGKPMHPLANEYALASLDRFSKDFAKWLRGDARIKDDRAISSADIAANSLLLFGDPGSNSVLAQVVRKLPIRWTKESIQVGARTFSAADHVPLLIYPNPLNPKRYIVINSGSTLSAADLEGTNALQYSRLGDYAVMKLDKRPDGAIGNTVATAGIFNQSWRIQ